jgi:transcriptional regulator with XRE-family HTH domain
MVNATPATTLTDAESASSDEAPMGSGEKAVRALAAAAGHRTLRSVARAANVDRVTLRYASRGERPPTRAVVERIAKILAVTPEFLAQIFEDARRERGSR